MEQKETWQPVVGFEETYEVSSYGRVRNRLNGYILKQFPNIKKYLYVNLQKDKKHFGRQVHRLVAMAFIPNPDNLPQINHKDENKQNNHIDNLEWCTNEYNARYGSRPERVSKTLKGVPKSPETKAKMQLAQDKRKGIPLSEETKKKISESKKGKHPSPETRAKLREARAKVVMTQETREKIRLSHIGHVVLEETRRKISETRKLRYGKK